MLERTITARIIARLFKGRIITIFSAHPGHGRDVTRPGALNGSRVDASITTDTVMPVGQPKPGSTSHGANGGGRMFNQRTARRTLRGQREEYTRRRTSDTAVP